MTAFLVILAPIVLAVFAMQMERFETFSTRSSSAGASAETPAENAGSTE